MKSIVKQVDQAFMVLIVVCALLLVLITAVMIYFIIRYRKSANPEPSDIRGNVKVEIAWMIIPLVIVMAMFYLGWQSFLGLRTVPRDALQIRVEAMQFAWVFKYPNNKESEGLLMVPRGRAIKLNLTSLDVIHGFYVPAFRIKMDALHNMETYAWFYADRIGSYDIMCTQYCGEGHAEMSATLRIVSEDEYAEWLKKK